MAGQFPQINDNFETASQDLITERRACYVIEAFTTGTLGKTFDAYEFQASLAYSETAEEYVMEVELLPVASNQNGSNLEDLAVLLVENIVTIRQAVVEGSHEPFMIDFKPTQRGFELMTPDLRDFTTLYAQVSADGALNWHDAKFCAEFGRAYSLVDLEHVIALVPQAEDEESMSAMDRPLDLGMPKPRLQ